MRGPFRTRSTPTSSACTGVSLASSSSLSVDYGRPLAGPVLEGSLVHADASGEGQMASEPGREGKDRVAEA
jgi:hypothetical protein